ncbi:DUF58 domain-containing protein [Telmatocola sphagniphila]|uniref:DUF58 domain-containing protein n=1 Tax=Telmatocola sphagniphila TaxID=1123043 RepID=A0A8E6B4Z3_9BACT|nr:DUF58 domain-containing protein [Telmatocola sphagniphila]QVL30603.1 DUF58 domain-containing protein [Telmatocola sphagniphila]
MTEIQTPLLDGAFLSRLEQLEIVSKKILQGRTKGDRLSKRKGQSVEFADFRNYVVGDDLRYLDWNLYARLDKLFLRLFHEEEDLHFHILIDNSKSMDYGSPTKMHYARQVAAALGFIGLVNHDRVMVESFNDHITQSSAPIRGRRNMMQLVNFLNKMEPSGPSDLTKSLKAFSMKTTSKGVVVILSDFLDKGGFQEGLRYLLARQFDIYVIQILSQEEIEPPMTGDLKLIDIEDGDRAEVTMSAPLLKRYQDTLNAFRGALGEFCVRRGISYLFTSNQVPFEKLVLGYLRKRGLVR